MNYRDRVLETLNHREPDKVVIDFNGHHSSGIMIQAYIKLREYLGLPKSPVYVYDFIQQLALVEEDVLNAVGADIVEAGFNYYKKDEYWKDWEMQDGTVVKIPKFIDVRKNKNGEFIIYSDDGEALGKQPKSSLYFDQTYYPLAEKEDDDFNDIDGYMQKGMWFKIGIPPAPAGFDKAGLAEREKSLKNLRSSTERAIYSTFGGNILEGGEFLFGIENFLVEMGLDPKRTIKFLDMLLEKHLENLEKYLKLCGEYIDIIHFSDDLGTNNGPLISVEMYKKFIKPCHKAMWELVKKICPEIKISLHSCGGIYPLIPELIEIGLDTVNPVQTTCKDMELSKLKKEFGNDLCFWGGGCDTRDVLPNRKPEEIKEHVRRNMSIMAPGGGYVFQQVHNIMADVPPENIVAMFEAVNEF